MLHTPSQPIDRHAGFSLVEIMVALVIGMLAIIVMMQIFAISEERKRTATSGGDAQSNGAMMFYQLQRDISQAGYGFADSIFGCPIKWAVSSGADIVTPIPLAPVTINPSTAIIPSGDAGTDTMLVMFGSTNGEPQGNLTSQSSATTFVPYTAVNSFTAAVAGVGGDRVIVAPGATSWPKVACATTLVLDRVVANNLTTITLQKGAAGSNAIIYNLGSAPSVLAYRVHSGNLTVCDYLVNDCGLAASASDSTIWQPVASNIVSMKAQYFVDTSAPSMDGIADVYDQRALNSTNPPCDFARVSAVRFVLVGRSTQFERDAVTTSVPTWSGSSTANNPAGSTAAPIDLSGYADYTHYRYKVFEGVAPIRNVMWLVTPAAPPTTVVPTVPAGCDS